MFNVSYWLVEAIRAPAGVFASRLSCVEIWELQDHKVVHRWFSLDYRIRICWIMLISLINFIGFVINCDHRCPFPIFSNCYSGCQRLAAHVEIPRKSGGSTRSSKLEHHGVVEIHDKKTHMKKTKQRDLKDVLWIFRVFFRSSKIFVRSLGWGSPAPENGTWISNSDRDFSDSLTKKDR